MTRSDVKLVIWDLDDTLWNGTLTEDREVLMRDDLKRQVRWYTHHGIINSICSNNDFGRARDRLQREELWNQFVFPQISWEPKPTMVHRILSHCQLQAGQALFIDDNPRVRAQVERACGVQGMAPEDLPTPPPGAAWGADRSARLEHYRILERRNAANGSPVTIADAEFLRSCAIQVAFHDVASCRDRVLELASRAHQLNFTRRPLDSASLDALLNDPDITVAAVSVIDRFGDYGIAGFYAVNRRARRCEHLLFSCRVLNMGIEQWLYEALGRPAMSNGRVPPARGTVDWIRVATPTLTPSGGGSTAHAEIVLKGGCDVSIIATHLKARTSRDVVTEGLEVTDGVQRYGDSSLTVLTAANDVDADVPWLSHPQPAVWRQARVLVLSLWVDYVSQTCRHRATGQVIPCFALLAVDTPPETWTHWWGSSQAGRAEFLSAYTSQPELAPQAVADLLVQLRWQLPAPTRLIVINGAEVETPWRYTSGSLQHERNYAVNAAVDQVVRDHDIGLLDVRKHVRTRTDLAASDDGLLTHFSRRAYTSLAADLAAKLQHTPSPRSTMQ